MALQRLALETVTTIEKPMEVVGEHFLKACLRGYVVSLSIALRMPYTFIVDQGALVKTSPLKD